MNKSFSFMNNIKINNIVKKRNKWLTSGEDTLINTSNYIDKVKDKIYKDNFIVRVSDILDKDKYKVITLKGIYDEELPIFKAGNKVSLTIFKDNKYYSKAYTIISSPSRSYNSEYKLVVKNNDTIVDNYLFNQIRINETVILSNPFGEFYYNVLRDQKDVIAIISNDGIYPIMSMIYAILDGVEDFNLTVLYTEKKFEDIMFYKELLDVNNKSDKINIEFFLSQEDKKGCIKGFVTKEKIKEIMKGNNTSFYLSGSEGLLKYLNKELESLNLPKKLIRYEEYLPLCNIKKVQEYKLTIFINNEKYELPCYNNKTIIQAIYQGGIYIPNKCNVGSCGFCKSELLSGEVKIVNDKRDSIDKKYNYIHPCCTYPLSDIKIIVR